jgi:hypothetical protein
LVLRLLFQGALRPELERRRPMELALTCLRCATGFTADLPEHLTHRLAALGDGQTFEDLLYTSLSGDGHFVCPVCDAPVQVREENLNQLAMELLACC